VARDGSAAAATTGRPATSSPPANPLSSRRSRASGPSRPPCTSARRCTCPRGPARVTFRFDIDHATRAQFWLAHGTQVDKTAIWLGEDSYTANGWSVGMRYGERGFTDNLIIRATGPGGTAEEFVGVTNNGGA
jgi:hypothetical protein